MADHYAHWLHSLTIPQRNCLIRYKGMEYKNLNIYMRLGEVPGLTDAEVDDLYDSAEIIRSAFASDLARLPMPLTVYRGLKREYPPLDCRINDGLFERAFMSVSLSMPVAKRICLWDDPSHSSTVLEISLPAGTPAVWLEPLWDKGEYEILLPPPVVLHISGITSVSITPLRRVVQCQRVQRPT
ncbi:ADP-ribosyltransferase [Deinococcus arenicola]|uniref:ADP-ribosyltransferase n=1 Tax=Deinococcus arenicola TaxID=2994950 RepID=UPI003D67C12D